MKKVLVCLFALLLSACDNGSLKYKDTKILVEGHHDGRLEVSFALTDPSIETIFAKIDMEGTAANVELRKDNSDPAYNVEVKAEERPFAPGSKVFSISVPFKKEDKERQIIFAGEKLGKWSVVE